MVITEITEMTFFGHLQGVSSAALTPDTDTLRSIARMAKGRNTARTNPFTAAMVFLFLLIYTLAHDFPNLFKTLVLPEEAGRFKSGADRVRAWESHRSISSDRSA